MIFGIRRFSSKLVESGGFEPQLLRPFATAYAITFRFTASTTLMWHHSPKSGVFNKQPTPIAVYSPFSVRSQGKVFATKPFRFVKRLFGGACPFSPYGCWFLFHLYYQCCNKDKAVSVPNHFPFDKTSISHRWLIVKRLFRIRRFPHFFPKLLGLGFCFLIAG